MTRRRAKNFRRARSAGAVIFRNGNARKYLLLQYETEKEYWGFPKGIVEQGENEEDAARREITEEAGITAVTFAPGFQEHIHYFFREAGTLVSKDVIYFLAEARADAVKISAEHKGFGWFSYDEAREKLTYNKEILEAAERFLAEHHGLPDSQNTE